MSSTDDAAAGVPTAASATSHRGMLLTPRRQGGGQTELVFEADALVIVEGGRITHVGPWSADDVRGDLVDRTGSILVPGFVDTHVHFPQTRVVGSASGPLLEWLASSVFPEEARFRELGYARAVAAEFTERLLSVGTTTASIFSSSDPGATNVCFEALDRAGLRATLGLTLMDQSCPDALRVPADVALPAARDLVDRWHGHDGGRLRFAVTPRFAIACSRPMMEAAALLASDRELPIQTHVSENAREGQETLALHPWGKDYVDVYDRVGLVGPRTILAHAIHLAPRESEAIHQRGASLAHCPDSNFFLGSGCMRLEDALRRGIRVGLGTDVAAGRSFDLRRTIAAAYDASLVVGDRVSPEELFMLATLGGARALGLDAVTGSIEVGKDADFVQLSAPAWLSRDPVSVLAHVAFAADQGRVEATYIRGVRRWSASPSVGAP
jgi:guanine deaminase